MQMNTFFFSIIIFSLFCVISGCKSKIILEKHILWKGNEINIAIAGLKTHKSNQQEVSLLYGTILFQTKNKQLKFINLNCIAVSIGDEESDRIAVDSIAHILTENFVLEGNLTKIRVYWIMNSLISRKQLNNNFVTYIKQGCQLAR